MIPKIYRVGGRERANYDIVSDGFYAAEDLKRGVLAPAILIKLIENSRVQLILWKWGLLKIQFIDLLIKAQFPLVCMYIVYNTRSSMQKILFRTPNIIKVLIIFGLIVYTIYSLFF